VLVTERSFVDPAARDGEVIGGRDDVVGAAHSPRDLREPIEWATAEPDHALEHLLQDRLVPAEPDEDRPVAGEGSVGDVAAEDLAEMLLVSPRDVRCRGLGVKFRAVGLATADDVLLRRDRQSLPADRVVLPLLRSRIDPPSPGDPGGMMATVVALTSDGFSVPSMKPVRSRSWWYGQPTVSLASSAMSASAMTTVRDRSNTTS
jgi:hypothetical protein